MYYSCKPPNSKTEPWAELTGCWKASLVWDLLSKGTANPLEHPMNMSLLCKRGTDLELPWIDRWCYTRL